MRKKLFDGLMASLGEAAAHARGEKTGVRVRTVRVPRDVNVKAIRRRLGMTQRQFAKQFGFPVGTVQNWERGHRRPEGAARALLKVIEKRPDVVLDVLAA
ncbi:MAG: transcriptional regulator [Rhodospirillales bacterium RIFCSPLOWO2_12_FULL_67_15]|nr:MAG: transcriptional regulator [Rhodospirillales bacterium RIFCSPLOWO2_12_FULL_67_15]